MSPLLEQLLAGARLMPALLDTAAKGLVIMALTAVAALVMRRSSAAARHLVWFLGTASLLILPILSAALPGWHILPQWTTSTPVLSQQPMAPLVVPASAILPHSPDAQLFPDYTSPEPRIVATAAPAPVPLSVPASASLHLSWQAWILLAWLAGVMVLLGNMLLCLLSLLWLEHRSSRIVAGHWPALLLQLRAHLGIRRPVDLLCSHRRSMPMTWGLWRTRLLLPEESATWSPDQGRAVLLHELAHARRWDCLTQLIVQIACALYWFNPLVWLAWHRIQTERERACDDLVLRTGTKPSAYAEQLLHIAEEMPTTRYSAAAIAMARPGTLEGRLRAILDSTRNRRAITWTAGLLAALLVGAFAVPLAMVRAAESVTQPIPPSQARIYEQIYILRHSTLDSRQDEWCAAIKELAEIGKPAVPALVRELDHTDSIFEKSAIAFAMRAIGDPRAIPALIRALPRSTDQIGGFELMTANEDLQRFMNQHACEPDPHADMFVFNWPLDELDCTLRKITGHSEGKIYPDTDSPADQAAAAAVRREMGKRWTKWWTENWHRYVSDAELATVENHAVPPGDPVEAAGVAKFGPLFPAGKDVRLGPVHDLELPAEVTIDVKAYLNFDTGRTFSQFEGSRLNSPADVLRWRQETGIDAHVNGGEELVGHDVRAWLVDNVLWDKLPDELATRDAIDPGIKGPSSSFYPCRVEDVGRIDPGTLPATFLFITREGGRGILQILSQETPPKGLHIRYRMFESPRLPAMKAPTLPTQSARAGLSFGAEHQVTLHDPRSKMDAAVSFDTGETFVLPDGAFAAGYEKWLNASTASVMAWLDSDRGILAGVLGNKIGLREIAPEAWDRLTPAEVFDLSSRFPPSSYFSFQVVGISPSLPQTGVFQTPKGTMGLVQITEANGVSGKTSPMAGAAGQHPTTLKLRYKIVLSVQPATAASRPVAVAPDNNTVELLAAAAVGSGMSATTVPVAVQPAAQPDRLVVAPTSELATRTVATQKNPAETPATAAIASETAVAETAWGKVVDGLQVGLHIEEGKRSWRIGESFCIAFVVRNVSQRRVELTYEVASGYGGTFARYGLRLRDSDGQFGYCHLPPNHVVPDPQTSLAPGQTQILRSSKVTIWPIGLDRTPEPGTLIVEPGKYSLSLDDMVHDRPSGVGVRSVADLTLTSGTVELEILPARPDDPLLKAVSTQPAPSYSTADIKAALSVMGHYMQMDLDYGPIGPNSDEWSSELRAVEKECAVLSDGAVDFLGHLATTRSDEFSRRLASQLLGSCGEDRATGFLLQALADESDTVRSTAARAIEQFRTPEVIQHLVQTLKKDKVASVRAAAAFALGYVGNQIVTTDLVEALKSERDAQALDAIFIVLGWLKDTSVIPALEELRTGSSDPGFQYRITNLIRRIKDPKSEGTVRRPATRSVNEPAATQSAAKAGPSDTK